MDDSSTDVRRGNTIKKLYYREIDTGNTGYLDIWRLCLMSDPIAPPSPSVLVIV